MSPKYSTDQDSGTHWHTDKQLVMATWTTKPFVGHRHRHETVHHRIVVEYTHKVGVDVRHEVRSEDSAKFPDNWASAESVEVRDYGARHDRHECMRWLQ